MHSIRTKITAFIIAVIMTVITVAAVVSILEIKKMGKENSDRILYLMCEEGEKTLDAYFASVEQSVETVSGYAENDLDETSLDDLAEHLKRVEELFEKTASHTNGVLTYYYRIDPEISKDDNGFWYVNLDGKGFRPHEVTDITLYDTSDRTQLVWFTVPKADGTSVWIPPYYTDNLDVYVFSYNVPVRKDGIFVGVIGIEIDYNTIIAPIKEMELYDNGYAFINDAEGNIIYHPRLDITSYTGDNKPRVPDGLLSDSPYIRYEYNGEERQAVWLPLNNGMRLNVSVPIKEINEGWLNLINKLVALSLIAVLLFIWITMQLAERITRPLQKLTEAAEEVNNGNYNLKLSYHGDDEVAMLTKTFNQLTSHLKVYIKDLNDLAYSDPLTEVHNKGAFDIYIRDLQIKMDDHRQKTEFAIGIFDCNNLKLINDRYGHIAGDSYLKASVSLICSVFAHSPVFRTGGDEFAVILQKEDYKRRDELARLFESSAAEISAAAGVSQERLNIAMGIAVYNPETDASADNVVRRADMLMYRNKRAQKSSCLN